MASTTEDTAGSGTQHKHAFPSPEESADLSAHTAALNGDFEGLREILKKDPEAILALKDARGRTPIHYAAMGNSQECVRLLLDNGASVIDSLDCSNLSRKNFYISHFNSLSFITTLLLQPFITPSEEEMLT